MQNRRYQVQAGLSGPEDKVRFYTPAIELGIKHAEAITQGLIADEQTKKKIGIAAAIAPWIPAAREAAKQAINVRNALAVVGGIALLYWVFK